MNKLSLTETIIQEIETYLIDYAKTKGSKFHFVFSDNPEVTKEELNDDIKAFLTTALERQEKETLKILKIKRKKFFETFDKNFYKDVEVGTRGGTVVALVWKEHPMEAKLLLVDMFDELERITNPEE